MTHLCNPGTPQNSSVGGYLQCKEGCIDSKHATCKATLWFQDMGFGLFEALPAANIASSRVTT